MTEPVPGSAAHRHTLPDPHTVSADDVQNAVDDADGHHDGDIATQPECDVDAVLLGLERGIYDDASAALELFRIVLVQRGTNEGDAAAWARVAARLGPGIVGAAVKLARKLGGL